MDFFLTPPLAAVLGQAKPAGITEYVSPPRSPGQNVPRIIPEAAKS